VARPHRCFLTGTLTKNEIRCGQPELLQGSSWTASDVIQLSVLSTNFDNPDALDAAILAALPEVSIFFVTPSCVFSLLLQAQISLLRTRHQILGFHPFNPVSKRTEALVTDGQKVCFFVSELCVVISFEFVFSFCFCVFRKFSFRKELPISSFASSAKRISNSIGKNFSVSLIVSPVKAFERLPWQSRFALLLSRCVPLIPISFLLVQAEGQDWQLVGIIPLSGKGAPLRSFTSFAEIFL
jgi:hypothetical protein